VLGHRGHRMALPAWCRCLCGSWPRGQGPPARLPRLRAADGLLAWLSALGALWPHPADLGPAGHLPRLPGEPCAAAGVPAGPAAGRGRGDRRGAGPGGQAPWDAADRCLAGRAPLDRAGLASALPCPCPHPGRRPCRPGGRGGRERPGAVEPSPDTGRARLAGPRAGQPRPPASRRLDAHLRPRLDRPLDPSLASPWPGRPAPCAPQRHRPGAPPSRAIERGGRAARRAASQISSPHRRHPARPIWHPDQQAHHPGPPAPRGPGPCRARRPAATVWPLRGRAGQANAGSATCSPGRLCPTPRVAGSKRAKLFLLVDDHSRLLVHGRWTAEENTRAGQDVLRAAIVRRGLPQQLYVAGLGTG
jgi:hypothetical protein